tara:strand:+ start:397 stop:1011 length:615 start_codon:yes stop_codon:yes gene_type:complete
MVSDSPLIDELKARRERQGAPVSTTEQIDLKKAEGNIEIKKIVANESSKEVAGKHLAKFGAFYLLILVLSFIYSATKLPESAIAVVAGLVTLVVSNLSSLLKGITDTKDQKDPIELMYDIAEKNTESCERQHDAIITSNARAQKDIIQSSDKRFGDANALAQKSHSDMMDMLRKVQEKQPTSLSIQPDNVVIKQGDNTVKTSAK